MTQSSLQNAPTTAFVSSEIPLNVKEAAAILASVLKRCIFGLSESRFPISA